MEQTRDWNKDSRRFEEEREKTRKAEAARKAKAAPALDCAELKVERFLGRSARGQLLVGTRVRWVKVKRTFARQGRPWRFELGCLGSYPYLCVPLAFKVGRGCVPRRTLKALVPLCAA